MSEKTYQEKIDRLTEIITAMENDLLPLEKTVAFYEEGIGLIKNCEAELDAVQAKVMLLTEDNTEVVFEGEDHE